MVAGGKMVQLHYKEYFGSLPWRGNTKFIVDSIVSMETIPLNQTMEEEPTPELLDSM